MEGTEEQEEMEGMEATEEGVAMALMVYTEVLVLVKVLVAEMVVTVDVEEMGAVEVMVGTQDPAVMAEMQVLVVMFKFEV
jgi:hypothetical protein